MKITERFSSVKITEEQKNKLLTAVIAFVITVLTILGYSVSSPPQPAPAPQSGGIGIQSIQRNGIICDSGETYCVDARKGMSIIVYSDNGTTQVFKVTGSSGNTAITGTLDVTGATTLTGDTSVGNLTASGTITVSNLVSSSLSTSTTYLTSTNASITTLTASGATSLNGGLTMDTSAFAVADTSGNTQIAGTLGVTGTSTLHTTTATTTTIGAAGVGTLDVHAPATFTDTVTFVAASIADAALSANVPLLDTANTFTAAQIVPTTTVGSNGVGTLTVHAPATFTDTVTFAAASIADAALSANVPLKDAANAFTNSQTVMTTTVGANNVGALTVHAPATFTSTVAFAAASIADAALSANVPLLDAANAFTAAQTMVTTTIGSSGVGSATFHAPVTFTDTVTFPATAIADAALSANVPLKDAANTFTLAQTFSTNPILPSESITPTAGATITPTARIVTLTPSEAVTITLGACTTNTQMVVYNENNFDVIISDTGNFVAAGAQTIGQYDALPASCIATKWIQTGAVSAN